MILQSKDITRLWLLFMRKCEIHKALDNSINIQGFYVGFNVFLSFVLILNDLSGVVEITLATTRSFFFAVWYKEAYCRRN